MKKGEIPTQTEIPAGTSISHRLHRQAGDQSECRRANRVHQWNSAHWHLASSVCERGGQPGQGSRYGPTQSAWTRRNPDLLHHVDTSWINFLTGVFLVLLPPLGVVFLVERLIIASRDAPDVDAGAGCGALGLIPKEILIPGGQKVVAFYSRADVSNAGIFAGGSVEILPRSPEVTISGPTRLSVEEEQPFVTATYRLHTDDLRPPFTKCSQPPMSRSQPGSQAREARVSSSRRRSEQ